VAVSKLFLSFSRQQVANFTRNHVIGDLEPFICVFSGCLEGGHQVHGTDPVTFETSKAWSTHMQTAHGQTWECRAPSHDPIVFDQAIQYQEHAIREHGVPEAHIELLSNASQRPFLNKVLECPFGDDFQPTGKIESSAVFASEALQSHVAGHMKEIALLTLQKLPSNEDESVENVDSDQPFEDDGPGGGVGFTRASMYDILEDEDLDLQYNDPESADSNTGHRQEDISKQVTELDLEDKYDLGRSKLHHAVQAGDLDLVESLIQSGTSVHYKDKNGQTPLHYAVGRGSTKCVECLLNYGADPGVIDSFGFPPFLWAVVTGQEGDTLKLLIKAVNGVSMGTHGKSALAWAASLGLFATAKVLVEHDSTLATQRRQLRPFLGEAAAFGSLPTVRLLLDHGADPNQQDRDGWSAIHWAAEEGHLEIVNLLLHAGANPNAVSSHGTSPLHCAANGGHLSIVRLLLQNGADLLKSTHHGWTGLHHAVFMGHAHVVTALLDVHRMTSTAPRQDRHGWSILHLAIHNRDLAIVRILLEKSIFADIRAQCDDSGRTAEEWLDLEPTSYSQEFIADLALSKSRCCRAVTGLRQAVTIVNPLMIKLLFNKGHDINGMNSGRRTALYYAAKPHNNVLFIINLLLDLGADPNILPTGRKSWEEITDNFHVLLRLKLAGYRKRDMDREVEQQIRQALATSNIKRKARLGRTNLWKRLTGGS
jgi:ankyrin repeat protein